MNPNGRSPIESCEIIVEPAAAILSTGHNANGVLDGR